MEFDEQPVNKKNKERTLRTVIQMAEYYIQDNTAELNKRIDDAFTELDTQRNRISGLTRENSELKQEIERLESRINKTNNFIEFATLTYMCFAIAKFIAVLIVSCCL